MAFSECAGEEKKGECFCLLCRLPAELLALILSYLSVLDYFSFRAVCKCWRAAFERCPVVALENQAHKQLPWFLILRTEDPSEPEYISPHQRPLLYTTGRLGDLSSRHIYSTDIPELCGTQILLSKHGWLILYSSSDTLQSLFFLNPFSRARVDLPFMRVSELSRPVFDISGPPTSPNCLVFVSSWVDFAFKVSLCKRGESTWTTKLFGLRGFQRWMGPISNAVFINGIWYCFHQHGEMSTFDVANLSLKFLGRPDFPILTPWPLPFDREAKYVSYVVKRDDEVFLCIHGLRWAEISLSDPTRIFYTSWMLGLEEALRTNVEKAVLQHNELAMDSFNADAWCAECDSDKVISFRWHHFVSCYNQYSDYVKNGCHKTGSCSTVIMWIEPTWVHSSPNLSWAL